MKQFDIVTTAGGAYSSKPRPSVIIQSVGFDTLNSLTVIPLTTQHLDSEFRVRIEPSEINGLQAVSFAMIDKLTTIKRTALGAYIGHLENDCIAMIEEKLKYFIGLT
jgi:mRNA interferase MazF